jgi:hypothetical protein
MLLLARTVAEVWAASAAKVAGMDRGRAEVEGRQHLCGNDQLRRLGLY